MRKVHYIFSTHWDREWYQTFQDYRYRLVQLIDRVLEGWNSGQLNGPFQTDGQAILLEDYLEVRPEAKEDVQRRVQEGLIMTGPFYVQPDEFLVSGESLIRNLRLGRQIARDFGGTPSNAGLLADNFGHNSQMPQIFAGFGIQAGFLWRGTNLVNRRLFIWRGADGSELPCYRFGAEGYCSYAKFVRQQRLDEPRFSAEQLESRLEAFLNEESAKTQVGPLLAFDGGDHMEWDRVAYAALQKASRRLREQEGPYRIVHTSLDDYIAALLPEAGRIETILDGELREPARYPLSIDKGGVAVGTGSSRVWIKQANAACETLLFRWAEPFAAFAHTCLGVPYPQGFLDTAWKWLLQNHPHDSICGCSIDAVHADMAYRFHQCEQIANRLRVEATRKLAASVQGEVGPDELRCTVFNPSPRPFRQVAEIELEIPVDWPVYGPPEPYPARPDFRIFDEDGAEIPYQRLGQAAHQPRFRVFDTTFPRGYSVNAVRVALPLDLPPLGYATLKVRKGEEGFLTHYPKSFPPEHSPSPVTPGLRSMSNEFLEVTIEPNGTLTLRDRRTGNTYRDLLTFEDSADIGDGWNYGPADNDQVFLSTGCQAEIAQLQTGPFLAAFQIRVLMNLPEKFDLAANARSKQQAELILENRVYLYAGAEQVEIETSVYNDVRDHRLRVLFPTNAKADIYLADTPFDVIERRIPLRPDNHLYRQPEIETRPQQSWTAVFGEIGSSRRGLAVLSSGLYESAVQDTPERTVALTLLRATRRTVFTSGEEGGQVQRELVFRTALLPLSGPADRSDLFERSGRLAAGLWTEQLTQLDVELHRQATPLPARASFLRLEGALVLTSLRKCGEGLEVRLFNPDTQAAEGELHLAEWLDAERAVWVDFESRPLQEEFEVQDGTVAFTLAAKEIKTICFLLD